MEPFSLEMRDVNVLSLLWAHTQVGVVLTLPLSVDCMWGLM